MATKKKAKKPAAAAPKKRAARAAVAAPIRNTTALDDATIQLMVVCFTLMSIFFAVLAFWRYG
ncbi:MAG TPA: hypothetical protein VLI54_00615 [Bacillota bacterium]|nr:hypothetical protein [Bacillota bacterium]